MGGGAAGTRRLRRVGLNLLYLLPGRVGGTEIYARRLVAALAQARPEAEFVAFCAREATASLRAAAWPNNVRIVSLGVPAANKPVRIAAELTLLPLAARRAGVELLHSLGTTAPPLTFGRRVVTVLDLIYDHFPGTFPAASRLGLKVLVPLGARRSHRVIAISEAARLDAVARLRLDPARVDVTPLGPGMEIFDHPTAEAELRARFGLGADPVVLCVSAALEHKNIERLLRAFAGLDRPDARLVLVGHPGRDADRLDALAGALGVQDRFRMTGWISDADLEGLYRLAQCFVYPSLFEGFGMPVLEAMRRGLPVACADATSLPEVAGDAALLFDPLDETAIADALRRLLDDDELRAALAKRGTDRAAGFTWEACAQATVASYERALAG
jgi:glycosyltransferase involved in cell wall biosynthesis